MSVELSSNNLVGNRILAVQDSLAVRCRAGAGLRLEWIPIPMVWFAAMMMGAMTECSSDLAWQHRLDYLGTARSSAAGCLANRYRALTCSGRCSGCWHSIETHPPAKWIDGTDRCFQTFHCTSHCCSDCQVTDRARERYSSRILGRYWQERC